MLTWVTKKGANNSYLINSIDEAMSIFAIPSPKAYGFYKVTASKFTNLKD